MTGGVCFFCFAWLLLVLLSECAAEDFWVDGAFIVGVRLLALLKTEFLELLLGLLNIIWGWELYWDWLYLLDEFFAGLFGWPCAACDCYPPLFISLFFLYFFKCLSFVYRNIKRAFKLWQVVMVSSLLLLEQFWVVFWLVYLFVYRTCRQNNNKIGPDE